MATKEYTIAGQPLLFRLMAAGLRFFSKIHVVVYRWTGGVIGGRIFGNQILLLTTTGRKTGQSRTTPVAYLTDGEAMMIIGGAAGAPTHPTWWLNLKGTPQAHVLVGRQRLWVSASEATSEEQQQLWARHPAQQRLFNAMQQRISRTIPVVVLRPVSESNGANQARTRLAGSASEETSWAARAIHRAARASLYTGARLLNPLTLKLAGSRSLPMLAVIQHQGRRSGRSYSTPAGARPLGDGFVVPLTFGERTDWFRNVRVAGGCVIRWNGAIYPLIEPEEVAWATARPAFFPIERVLMPLLGIEQFGRLRHAPVGENEPT